MASRRSYAWWGRPSVMANDPELFAGLVHACRYCGLYEQSIAAPRRGAPARPERRHEPPPRRC